MRQYVSLTITAANIAALWLLTLACQAASSVNHLPDAQTIFTIKAYQSASKRQVVNQSIGFVFEEDGFILTSYSGLVDPFSSQLLDTIDVHNLGSQENYPATIVGVEPTINLAILKIFPVEGMPTSKFGDVTTMVPGQELFGITVNKDLNQGLNNDSAKEKLASLMGRLSGLNTRECYQESLTSTMFRAEMPLDKNNIGSPVFNNAGEVVAIYTAYKPQASLDHKENEREVHLLPIKLAQNIYESLKHKKSMRSPWTGFSVIPLNATQRTLFPTDKGDKGGIAIEYVWDNSPAATLGIQTGDILVRFGHYRIESPADFQKWLYMYGVGHAVRIVLLRDKDYLVKEYTIEERPDWAIPK